MSAIYEKADQEVIDRVAALIEKNHFNLKNLEVRIDLIFAVATVDDAGEPTGPAVSHQGYPAYAISRILNSKDRIMGRGDCEIVIDNDKYPMMSDAERDALLDHELEHFQLKTDRNKNPTFDDLHRPKLRLKKHDFQVGWFHNIAQRHGLAAIETKQFRGLCMNEITGQIYLPFIDVNSGLLSEKAVAAIKKLSDMAGESGGSVTISSGDKSVTFGKKKLVIKKAGESAPE
jgi:hypothetical protein